MVGRTYKGVTVTVPVATSGRVGATELPSGQHARE